MTATSTQTRTVNVSLGERSYDILIGRGLLREIGARIDGLGFAKRCAVISDSKVFPLFGNTVMKSLKQAGFDPVAIVVPSGEKSKSIAQVSKCFDALAKHRLERKSFVVALGGGVVGDLAGFVAASYLRGIPFVQIPTTLLSQVDSSVGGKVGINLKAGKNLVGAFHQPRLVLCDLQTLKTLPEREYRSGLAEVIKYGIIYDARLHDELERTMPALIKRNPEVLSGVIARCCEIKAEVVGQDETETGLRAILNFGHTVGHALEAISGYGKFLHGEAISIGQVAAAELSHRLSGLSAEEVSRIRDLFARAGLPVKIKLGAKQLERLQAAMRLDKKVSDGDIKFVLAKKIGEVIFGQKVAASLIPEVLK